MLRIVPCNNSITLVVAIVSFLTSVDRSPRAVRCIIFKVLPSLTDLCLIGFVGSTSPTGNITQSETSLSLDRHRSIVPGNVQLGKARMMFPIVFNSSIMSPKHPVSPLVFADIHSEAVVVESLVSS